MANWQHLPYDVLRAILSSSSIPCTTKVELRKDLGDLTNRLTVSKELKDKLDRVIKARLPFVLNSKKPSKCVLQSESCKITFTMFSNKNNKCMYEFRYKNDVDVEVVTYDNLSTSGDWTRHVSHYWA